MEFNELLARSDVLSIHAPLTPKTHNIINARTIAKMKEGAYIVNTARGGLIDEPALIEALQSRKLAEAGLDVVNNEPPKPDNPLFKLDNVTFTPHVGSDTTGTFAKVYESAVTDLLLLFSGKRPRHIVNPDVLDHERLSGVK